MLKAAGIFGVIAGCSLAGIIKAYAFRTRSLELENIIELIRIIQVEITYKREPLHKTFSKMSCLRKCWFSNVLGECSISLSENVPLAKAWNDAIYGNLAVCPLHKEDLMILEDLSMGLGKSGISGQEDIFEAALVRLDNTLKKSRLQEEKQGKMYRGMGISAGIIISILFL